MTADLARALSALCALDPGMPYEQWAKASIAAIAAGLTLDDIDAWSSTAPNYKGRQDIELKFRNVTTQGGTTEATLFKMAIDSGWKDPAKGRRNNNSVRTLAKPMHQEKTPPRAANQATASAIALWEQCDPATEAHPYIIAKRGRPDGLRVMPDINAPTIAGHCMAGWLVVPALSPVGELRSLQFIPPPGQGRKLNLPGAQFADGLYVVGNAAQSRTLYIVEGIGQAWACWSATGCASVVCFGAGRMAAVAEILRRRFPVLPLVVVADRGKESQAEAIARRVCGAWVQMPQDKPANYDSNDYAAEHGADGLADLLDNPRTPAMRYRLLGAADLINAPSLHWLVRGVLPAQGLAALYGASGTAKSFLALDLCAAVAMGKQWFDCRVKSAPVVYVALEGEAGFKQRVMAWQIHRDQDLPDGLRFVMQSFDLRNADDLADLARAVRASGSAGGLLVIDTLNRAASGADENTSADMGTIISAAKALQCELGGLVLLVHHSGKDQTKGLRGHSSLHAALDAAIEVTRNDERRDWRIAKAKDGDDSAAYPFRLEVVEIGEQDDGEAITSCVVEPDHAAAELRRVIPPKSGNQKIAWDTLNQMLRQKDHSRPEGAPDSLPMGKPAITLESAVEAIRERLACDSKRKTERAQQALTGLHSKRLVCIDRGSVWMP